MTTRTVFAVILAAGSLSGPNSQGAPPLPLATAPLSQTSHLQRALALANAVDTNTPSVRVLFYGQSIIQQRWWVDLQTLLLSRYPGCSWHIENRALGGHIAEFLVKTAEADVYPYQPDLLIFHDYGDAQAYGEFISRVRTRTCADILLVADHIASYGDPNEDTNNIPVSTVAGTTWFDYVCQPQIALTNGACRADIRTPWKQYLISNQLSPTNLLVDSVHLNYAGCNLMTDLLSPYLQAPILQPPVDPFLCDRVKRVSLAQDAFGKTNQVTIPFIGNRVLFRVQDTQAAHADFLIDGLKPSGFIPAFVHGRCSPWPKFWWPAILKIEAQTVPVAEDWTLTVDSIEGAADPITFHVQGTTTGADGMGRSDADFTSTSGRVVILSEDWYWQTYQGGLTNGMQFNWSTSFNGADSVDSSAGGSGGGRWLEIIQGLTDQAHVLTLTLGGGATDQFPELLVYHPGGSELGGDSADMNILRFARQDSNLLLCWPEQIGVLLRSSSDLVGWTKTLAVSPLFRRCQADFTLGTNTIFYQPSN